MPSDLIPTSRRNELAPALGSGLAARASRDRQTSRALAQVERQTLVRIASVQGHAMVQTEKLHEIDRLSREAMSGRRCTTAGARHSPRATPSWPTT